MSERAIQYVPRPVLLVLVTAFLLQLVWAGSLRPPPQAVAQDLHAPPALETANLYSLGDNVALARYLMLWLQSFDVQPGISLGFIELDYDRLIAWLRLILELDPESGYVLLSAARVYAEVPDAVKKRQMLEFVAEEFLDDPDRRWRWLAHAVYVARHRLDDFDLALHYAQMLHDHTSPGAVPHWARQMHIYTLEQMGDVEAAMVLLGGLIESGAITDAHELNFLQRRLEEMQESANPHPDPMP